MLRSMILREIQQHVTGFDWYGAGPVCLKHHRYEYDELKQKFSLRFYFDFASFKSLFNIKLEDLSVLSMEGQLMNDDQFSIVQLILDNDNVINETNVLMFPIKFI